MTTSTMIVLAAVVALFAGFASALAWAQPHARQLTAAPADAPRPRRRPF
jgi:Flp pilus assembly protein CpaB